MSGTPRTRIATFSMVADRFGSRMNWVVAVLVAVMHWCGKRGAGPHHGERRAAS